MTTGVKISLASVVTLVALAMFLGSFVIVGSRHLDTASSAEICVSNLHQIGFALQLYQDENHGQFPRTLSDNSDDPKPNWGTPYQSASRLGPVIEANPFKHQDTTPLANDVTASLFLLARTQQLPSSVFVCPQSAQQNWDYGGNNHSANDWTNWQGNAGLRANLSYSFQNLYISRKAIDAGFVPLSMHDYMFAIASDMNPGGRAVTSVTMRSTAAEMKFANSCNHQGNGQNVLYGDGHDSSPHRR